MKNFSIKRFGQLMRWEILTEKRGLLTLIGSALLLYIFFEYTFILQHIDIKGSNIEKFYEARLTGLSVAGTLSIFFAILFGSSVLLTYQLKSKQRATAYFGLPASLPEKFCSRILLLVIGGFIISTLSFCIIDLLRMAVQPLFGKDVPAGSAIPKLFDELLKITINTKSYVLFSYFFIFWIQSCYLLGSMFFKKNSFFAVTGLFILLFALLSYAPGGLFPWIFHNFSETFISIVLLLLTIFNWVITYLKFTRMQIIRNKWINV